MKNAKWDDVLNFANWMSFTNVDFGNIENNQLTVRAAVLAQDTSIEVRLDGKDGPLIADMDLPVEKGEPAPMFKNYRVKLKKPLTGIHTIHITFKKPRYTSWSIRDNGIVDVD